MKNKVSQKLILYFMIIVIANSLITGGIFIYLGQKSYVESYKEDLARRAENISDGISNNMDIFGGYGGGSSNAFQGRGQGRQHQKDMHISPRYINWMNQVLDGKVWIIYKDDRVFQRSLLDINIPYEKLSESEKAIIDEAFAGKVITTESFENIFEEATISAVAPLKDSDNAVYGAILIHENISLTQNFLDSAYYVLWISIVLGVLIASALVLFFADRFIKPIGRIDAVAKEIIGGDYQIKTGVSQHDEIGDLARNIDELSSRLEKARIETDKLDKMRDDFIANISHELKTPVTVIKSSLEGLVSGVIKGNEVEGYHELLYEEISVLERLVSDLMELNAVKNVDFPMNFREEDMLAILKDAARSQRVLAGEKAIDLVLDLEDDYYMYECDYTRFRQMFITVINNAIKYSEMSGTVTIREFKDDDQIKVQVINKGKVIDQAEVENLFHSFYRVKDTDGKGFGLGLAIAKGIADRHNIVINVFSTEEQETVFEFAVQQ